MEFNYRKGTIEDQDQLQALGLLAYGQHQLAMTPGNWKRFHTVMADPETFTYLMSTSTCFLCEHGQEIVGMAYLVSSGHPTEMFDASWSYIRMVGVNPKFGGNGIAKKLTKMCLDHAGETGEKYVALHTSEFMDAARHIYESLGFKTVREFNRYDKTYWIYLLELNTENHD